MHSFMFKAFLNYLEMHELFLEVIQDGFCSQQQL
jgi:hypothetical protein